MNLRSASEMPLEAENVHTSLFTVPTLRAQRSRSDFPDSQMRSDYKQQQQKINGTKEFK